MIYLWIAIFIVLLVAFWMVNFFGLPGNWLVVMAAVVWMLWGPEGYRFGWLVPVLLVVLALIGEALEFAASMMGAKRVGGSNRGSICAVVGSIAGALGGAILGIPIPIPVVGILLGAILFAGIGAMVGAIIGEHLEGKTWQQSLHIGHAAFWGRVAGSVGKIMIGMAMVTLTVVAVFVLGV